MKRIVFSFPVAICTFLLGVAVFAFANALSYPVDRTAVPDLFATETESITGEQLPFPSYCDEDDVKEVYFVILDLLKYRSQPTILLEFTQRGGTLMDGMIATRKIEGAQVSTIADFELRNKESTSLRELFDDRADVIFFTAKDSEAMSSRKYARFDDEFRKRFPNSHRLVTLSSVGFDPRATEALVYSSYYCGQLCAGGAFYILKKVQGRWVLDHEHQLWVS
jgi:hypothetical protein